VSKNLKLLWETGEMKFLLTVIFVVSFNLHGHCNEFWKKDYSAVDSIARTIRPTANLEKLVDKLTQHCSTDVEKYRSIFTWITHHIAYDLEAKAKPALRVTDPEKVIKRGKAVCAGYSALFLRLCELAGLECVTVTGWAKDKQGIGKPLAKTADHAWNAIRINNEWYLCDVTWGAGSTTESTGIFSFDFKDFYFCTPPDLFSYNHFPKDEQWFLGSRVPEKKFTGAPHFYAGAIKLCLKRLSPEAGILKYKKGKAVDFRFAVDGKVSRIYVQPSTLKKSITIPFSSRDGFIEFQYVMEEYAPYLYAFADDSALLVYKMVR
jgi:hypothetical protein